MVHTGVDDVFIRLETRQGHVYHSREEYVEYKGRKHAPLAKTLFPGEPIRALAVVEPHACPYAIAKLTDD